MPVFVTGPFVVVRTLLKDPEESAAGRASRSVCQIMQLPSRVSHPGDYQAKR